MARPMAAASLPVLGDSEAPDLRTAARHLERLGFESVWAPDLIVGDGTPALEAVVAVATAAAVTERVNVGFSVLTLPLRPPAWVAAQIATLQHVSGNRILLGVGSGGFPGTPFWQAVGVPARERGRRTDTALRLLPRLVEGEPTVIDDQPDRPVVTLAPAAPAPPILVGGNSEVAIRRAATVGDGWFPSLLTPDALATGVARLRALAAEHGRPMPTVTVGGHAMPGDDADSRAARDAFVRGLVDDHGMPPDQAEAIPVTGSPRRIAERFAAYAEAGADRIAIGPDGGDWHRQWERVAEAHRLLD